MFDGIDLDSPEYKKRKEMSDQFCIKLANSNLSKRQIKRQIYCHLELYYLDISKDLYKPTIDLALKHILKLRNC